MFSTFVGLGSFINCQRPDYCAAENNCQEKVSQRKQKDLRIKRTKCRRMYFCIQSERKSVDMKKAM